jgi:hypothetical protein
MKTLMILIAKVFEQKIELHGEDFAGAFAILGIFGFIIYLLISKRLRKQK